MDESIISATKAPSKDVNKNTSIVAIVHSVRLTCEIYTKTRMRGKVQPDGRPAVEWIDNNVSSG